MWTWTRTAGSLGWPSQPHKTMAVILLDTIIHAPRERVFDLARSIDLHKTAAAATKEEAIAGVTEGLIGLDQEVTWRARHLGIYQRLKVRIAEFNRPVYFQDVMVSGVFASMVHDHFFEARDGGTAMRDRFEFRAPLGFLGSCAERLFLKSYLERFLIERNTVLKRTAESEEWKRYLK